MGDEYLPLDSYSKSDIKIRFKHRKCNSIFKMIPANFLRGYRCPVCMCNKVHINQRKTPLDFKKEFDKHCGNEYFLASNYERYYKKIAVLHLKCGNLFWILPHEFIRGHRCPHCKTKWMKLSNKDFVKRIEKLGEGDYQPLEKYKNTMTPILMLHKSCGKQYYVNPNSFFSGHRCPYCKSSRGEKAVQKYLKAKGLMFKDQYKLTDCADKRPLPFDFAVFNADHSINCLIEYQGEQHFYDPFSYTNQWFNKKAVLNTQKHDAMKLQYCKEHGIKLIRINHPQTSSKSNSIEFIERLVNRTLNKELHVV